MKRLFYTSILIISLIFVNCTSGKTENKNSASVSSTGVVQQLTSGEFRQVIYNYDTNPEWKFEGTMPVIIDFYADWCPPCRQLSPLVEEIAKEYNGKIVVYKVDTDKEKELAQKLGITSLPTLLYIPAKGKPQVTLGYIPKESIVKTINEVLSITN
jgi:thioredoxin